MKCLGKSIAFGNFVKSLNTTNYTMCRHVLWFWSDPLTLRAGCRCWLGTILETDCPLESNSCVGQKAHLQSWQKCDTFHISRRTFETHNDYPFPEATGSCPSPIVLTIVWGRSSAAQEGMWSLEKGAHTTRYLEGEADSCGGAAIEEAWLAKESTHHGGDCSGKEEVSDRAKMGACSGTADIQFSLGLHRWIPWWGLRAPRNPWSLKKSTN